MASLYRGLLMTALIGSGRPDAATLVPAGVEPGVVPAVVPVPPSLSEPELHAAASKATVTASPNTSVGRWLGDATVTPSAWPPCRCWRRLRSGIRRKVSARAE